MASLTGGPAGATLGAPPIIAALPTPFDEQLGLDEPAFQQLCSDLPEGHQDVLVAGTTGEFLALDADERQRLFSLAVGELGAEHVVAHVGAASTGEAIRLADRAADLGISRVALLTPFYLPADPVQVLEHFARFCSAHPDLDVFVYLFPDRTGVRTTPPELAQIAALPGIAGVKLSGAASTGLDAWLAGLRPVQQLYTGDDRHLSAVRARGGSGVVSGCFPVSPRVFQRVLAAEDTPAAPAAQAALDAAVDLLGRSIAHQKEGLRWRSGRPWRSRMSMPAVGESTSRAIRRLAGDVLA